MGIINFNLYYSAVKTRYAGFLNAIDSTRKPLILNTTVPAIIRYPH